MLLRGDQYMSNFTEVFAIVEGATEQLFIQQILAPYLAEKNIDMKATQVKTLNKNRKPKKKGGDVRFARVKKDIGNHLKQRTETYVTTFVDYYGIKEWPGIDSVPENSKPDHIAKHINKETKKEINKQFSKQESNRRFIPYMSIHEFEALLFSDSALLASELGINETEISDVLTTHGEPEAINNSPQTAPSKRLEAWSQRVSKTKFAKTSTGITLAKDIGISKMREKCPVFNAWIDQLETIVEAQS